MLLLSLFYRRELYNKLCIRHITSSHKKAQAGVYLLIYLVLDMAIVEEKLFLL